MAKLKYKQYMQMQKQKDYEVRKEAVPKLLKNIRSLSVEAQEIINKNKNNKEV